MSAGELLRTSDCCATKSYVPLYNSSVLNTNLTMPQPSRRATIIAASVMTVSLLMGICGTVWIIYVILRHPIMRRNVINKFVCSLCINDLINLVFNQTLVLASYIAHGWMLGSFLCAFMPELNMTLVAVSLWHHALISLHRYIVVVRNDLYKTLNKTVYVGLVVAGSRVLPTLLSICLALMSRGSWYSSTVYSPKLLRCIYSSSEGLRISLIVVLTFLLPATIVILCFSFISCFVYRVGRRSAVADRCVLRREIQITKMFGAVFAVFLLGYIPYGCVRMADRDGQLHADVYVLMTTLYAAASCMNPVILGVMNADMRKASVSLARGQSSRKYCAAKSCARGMAVTSARRSASLDDDESNRNACLMDECECDVIKVDRVHDNA